MGHERVRHWVYGSGMSGCLFDYGPNVAHSPDDAADALAALFGEDLSTEELKELLADLHPDGGIHRFWDSAAAGADYCSVTPCDCDSPRDHDPDYEAE